MYIVVEALDRLQVILALQHGLLHGVGLRTYIYIYIERERDIISIITIYIYIYIYIYIRERERERERMINKYVYE